MMMMMITIMVNNVRDWVSGLSSSRDVINPSQSVTAVHYLHLRVDAIQAGLVWVEDCLASLMHIYTSIISGMDLLPT
jgi:hypothetical protein